MTTTDFNFSELEKRLHQVMEALDDDAKTTRIKELEKETQQPDFWDDQEKAAAQSQELAVLQEEKTSVAALQKELGELKELADMTTDDEKLTKELATKYKAFAEKLEKEEIKIFLSGPYDKNNAIVQIMAGAGGVDAQDWATMLLRMYERAAAQQSFRTTIIHQSFGEPGGPDGRIGTKAVTLEVEGRYAYGLLKHEAGVHRLVRLSPFSAKKLRHTSFVLVEVLPVLDKYVSDTVELNPDDLKIETFRASGPGGQYVNRRETAVRITHLPTKLVASSQAERLQGRNKEKALTILRAKLHHLRELQHKKELKELKGDVVSASWGNQIRSYVFHPYQLVKDLRTGVETSDVEGVLNGSLDQFIQAEIKQTRKS